MSLKKIYLLSVGYLSISSVLFLFFWVKTPLNLIFISLYFVSLGLIIKKINEDKSLKEFFQLTEILVLLIFALFLTIVSGIGGFSYQVFDHIFHNSKIYDIASHYLPIFYKTENRYPTYYFGYYLPIGIIIKILEIKNISIPLFLWTIGGIFLGLSWLYIILKKNIAALILLFFIGGLFSFFFTLFQNPEKIFTNGYVSYTHMFLNYSGLLGNLLQVPNQIIPVLIVTPILLFELVRNNNFDRPIHIIASVFFWSPFSFIALSFLYISIFTFKKESNTLNKAFLVNFFTTLIAFSPIVFYLGSINESVDQGFFVKYETNYFFKWLLFVGLEVWVIFLIIYKAKFEFKIPLMVAVIFLSIIPFYKIGLGNDLCMRMSTPFLLILYIGFVNYLTKISIHKKYFFVIFVFLVGSLTPIKIVGRAILTFDLNGPNKLKYDKYTNTYEALKKNYSKKSADQYLMSENSFFEKYLLNKSQK